MSTTPPPAPPAQLTDILAKLRRHWPVVAVAAAIGAVLGVVASIVIPASYTAESTVTVNPMNANPLESSGAADDSVNMPTEEQVVTSRRVSTAAAELLEPRYSYSTKEVQQAVSVTTPDDSLTLEISFTGSTPKQAAAGATAVAKAYLDTRRADATEELERQQDSAQTQITALQRQFAAARTPIERRSVTIQLDALAGRLANLGSVDVNPGRVVGEADAPSQRSSPGPVPLGAAGAFLGLLIGVPIALTRKEEDSEIGSVEGLNALGNQIVLDGTKDTNRADTWDIAAFMLKIPQDLSTGGFVIMVDAADDPSRIVAPGQELVDALARRGRMAHFVDAAGVNETKINRGWPTDKKRTSWTGEVIVVDSTGVRSDTNKVALATRSDAVMLARTTTDDAESLRRLAGLMRAKNTEITLTALFPPRPELASLR